MRSHELDLARYDTDKIDHSYLACYDPFLAPFVGKEITLLEIGIHNGGSLCLWRDYFPKGQIVGIDLELPPGFDGEERIQMFRGDQSDSRFLEDVAIGAAPDGFDIIIDDASHLGEAAKASFRTLFKSHLKPGGLYVIEDWGTGYWQDWPDGRAFSRPSGFRRLRTRWPNHSHGMVGFIKQLVDEQGAADLSRGRQAGTPTRESFFESTTITPSIVFVRKRSD